MALTYEQQRVIDCARLVVALWDANNLVLPDNGEIISLPTMDWHARDLRKAVDALDAAAGKTEQTAVERTGRNAHDHRREGA